MAERHFFNLECEQILLHELIFSDVKHKLIQYCYPSIFYEGEFNPKSYHRIIFSIIKSLNDDSNLLHLNHKVTQTGDEELKHNLHELIHNDRIGYWRGKYEPFNVLKLLKELLFRRLTVDRAEKIISLVETEPIETLTRSTYQEANKIITLDRKLLKNESRSLESIARDTADKINTNKDTVQTGLSFINQRFGGLTRKSISSVLARPKHLKSTFGDSLISGTVASTNNRGVIISLEDPTEERIKRIIASRLNISLKAMRFKKIIVDPEDIINILSVTMKNRLFIYDVKDVLTPEDATAVINDVKPDIVLIDHIQKFDMQDMVIGIIRAVKAIEVAAIRNNCHVCITSQVSDKKIYGREDQSPQASDAQWTSALYQSSSEMMGLYYKYQVTKDSFIQDILEISVLASRYSDAVGKMHLRIDADKAFIGEQIE